MLKLCDITLSHDAANDEQLRRAPVFMKSDAYLRMCEDKGTLVIGRKGSGKSAIRIGLEHHADIARDVWCSISLEKLDTVAFDALLTQVLADVRVSAHTLLKNTWRLTIGVGIMRAMLAKPDVFAAHKTLLGDIERFLGEHKLRARDCELFPSYVLDRMFQYHKPPQDLVERERYPLIGEYRDLEFDMLSALEKGRGAVVTIDELDPQFDKYEQVVVPMCGALMACAREMVHAPGNGKGLRVKCFLPRDIVHLLGDRHLDKLLDGAVHIHWNPQTLLEFVARRLSPELFERRRDVPPDEMRRAVDEVLGKSIAGYFAKPHGAFEFLLYHTQYRPRDVMWLLANVFQRAVQEDEHATRVDSDRLFYWLQDAARDYADAAIDEFRGVNPDLARSAEIIRGESSIIPWGYLREKWQRLTGASYDVVLKQWPGVLNGLYAAGIIGYETEFRQRDGMLASRPAASFSFYRPTNSVRPESRLYVHPMFWGYFDVVPQDFLILTPR